MGTLRDWIRQHPTIKSLLRLPGNLFTPVVNFGNLKSLLYYPDFFMDYFRFLRMGGKTSFINMHPMLLEKNSSHSIDAHYFWQAVWAMKLIAKSRVAEHYDVGSQAIYVGMLTAITKVKFIDIRPLGVSLDNYSEEKGTILNLPMEDASVLSLSCLHVAEHVGLGRYGDAIDPNGTAKAAKELVRVLTPGGCLYFSMPVGSSRIEFNAHRVHSVLQVLDLFKALNLVQFSIVTDDGKFYQNVQTTGWENQNYACGMFLFTKLIRE
jgi:hypothetical protein